MGFFSWMTLDTNRSISNVYSNYGSFKVIMTDDAQNQWVEENYDGYGVFGGKDYYELLAEMNFINPEKHNRNQGINLEFYPGSIPANELKHDKIIYPSLSESGKYYSGKQPESCPDQGFFYSDYDDCDNYDDYYPYGEDDEENGNGYYY